MNKLKPLPLLNDHSARDPRSVAAMLRGHGDGRERAYLKFWTRLRRSHPELDEAQVGERYAEHVRNLETRRAEGMLAFKRGARSTARITLRALVFLLRLAFLLLLGIGKAFMASLETPAVAHPCDDPEEMPLWWYDKPRNPFRSGDLHLGRHK